MSEIGDIRPNRMRPGARSSRLALLVNGLNILLALALFGVILLPESILPLGPSANKILLLAGITTMMLCTYGLYLLLKVSFADFGEEVFENIIQGNPPETDEMDGGLVALVSANLDQPEAVEDGVGGRLEYTDRLTGLGNRQRMIDRFEKLVGFAEENTANEASGTVEFAVGILNLDGMKPINDMFGRAGGDAILKQCALRLYNALDGDGLVTRIGGDEFAFIFPDVTTAKAAEAKGGILLEVLQAPYDFDGRSVRISGSFGFGVVPQVGLDFEVVIDNLTSALNYSKRAGRGRVTVYSSEIEEQILENAKLEQALRRAIVNTEVKPHFQPIISLQDGSLLGFEALARWNDAELGFVSPGKFIPLAEERGIIVPLTESLLKQAATAASAWPEELFLSFNLSSVQIADPTTAATILAIIEWAGFDAKRLEIEVTETAIMSDPQTATKVIEDLHEAGIRISMDDFGTGQSSLGRLRELKLDKVKIDRTFVMEICRDKPTEHIVKAILEMCVGLELDVVAEGIEELPQAEALKRFGCHAGQGFLFGRAQNEHRTISYIREYMGDEALQSVKQAYG